MRHTLPLWLLAACDPSAFPETPGTDKADATDSGVPAAGEDLDGDGFAPPSDCAPEQNATPQDAEKIYVIYGPPPSGSMDLSGADAQLIAANSGDDPGTGVGVGDINGDGLDDLIVGAPAALGGTGAAYLLHGPVRGTIDLADADATFTGEGSLSLFGFSVAGAGDLDADGYDDLVVSALFENHPEGAVYVFYGPLLGEVDITEAGAKLVGDGENLGYLGHSISGAGDVNGDGFDDLVVGAPLAVERGQNAGAAYLFYGPVLGGLALSDADAILYGERPHDQAGISVSAAGDVDADGYDDLIVGAIGYEPAGAGGRVDVGAAYLLRGPLQGRVALADADAKIVGEAENDLAGSSVAGAGDVNGDGFDDLVIGAMAESSVAEEAGAVYVRHGPVQGQISLADAPVKLSGILRGSAGASVGGAGDVDGDGLDDIIFGARLDDVGGEDAGAACVFSGATLR